MKPNLNSCIALDQKVRSLVNAVYECCPEAFKRSRVSDYIQHPKKFTHSEIKNAEKKIGFDLPEDFKECIMNIGLGGFYDHPDYLEVESLQKGSTFLCKEAINTLIDHGVSAKEIERIPDVTSIDEFAGTQVKRILNENFDDKSYEVHTLEINNGGCGAMGLLILNGEDKGKVGYEAGHTFSEYTYNGVTIDLYYYEVQCDNIYESVTISLEHLLEVFQECYKAIKKSNSSEPFIAMFG